MAPPKAPQAALLRRWVRRNRRLLTQDDRRALIAIAARVWDREGAADG